MSTRWWRPALLTLLSLGALHAERSRPAVRTSGGPRRAKRTQPPKRLEVHAFAADSPGVELREHDYEEAMALAPDSVDVQVHACSLGAADVQQLRGEWGPCVMPLVPGRDAVGVVVGVGSAVKGLARGQRVAVLLGTGTDAENDADGADRGADSMTAGALAHHVRVPARWAFPVPAALPTAHVAGLLSVGGPIWAQLMSARLDKGAKLAVVGGGTAGALALSLGSALGLNVYEMGAAPVAALPEGSSKAAKRAHKKRLDATDEETGRLHGASFDAVLCVCGDAPLALDAFLPYAKPESSILLAGCAAKELVASPRTLQERRLSVVGAGATSAKERQRLLAFCAQHRVRLAQEASELDAPSACAALAAIEAEPEARKVLVRSALISSWMRANRTGTAVNAAPSADGLVQTGLASVFGVFNKVAEETKNAAKYAREGVSSTAAKLVEQVEEESKRELEQRHGSLSGFDVDVPADGGDEEEEDEDEGEGDGEEEDEDDDEYDDEDEDGEDDDEDDDDDDEEEEDDDEEDDDEEDADDDFDDEEEDEEDGGDDDDDDDDDDDEEED